MKIRVGKRLPKILRINRVDKKALIISVLFDTGENRILNFRRILKNDWKSGKGDRDYKLYDPEIFKGVELIHWSLAWRKIKFSFVNMEGKKTFSYFDVGADTLYDLSEPDPEMEFSIGEMFKKARLKSKLTQDQVARAAGTSRTYITKIENGSQDIELMTLKKIVEAGLNKQLNISIR